jgi:HD-GYP domain-containing protein (c-di-GMP phosphodiesterase class II)
VVGPLRVTEVTAALSLATDLGTGQPFEHALRTCLLSLRAGDELGVAAGGRATILHTSLLRFLGCTADASETAVLVGGDEIAFNATMAPVVMAEDREAVPHLLRSIGKGLPMRARAGRIAAALSDPGGKARSLSAHCEVGARLATRMGLPPEVTTSLAHAYERWDGRGLPAGLEGDEVPLAIRVVMVARDVDLWFALAGWDETRRVLLRRRGRAYDPAVVDAFVAGGPGWLDELAGVDPWEAVLDAEPAPVATVVAGGLDTALEAVADFADLKSPWFIGHSRAVAELAGAAATAYGLPPETAERVRRVGLLHDLGVVGVPAGVWNRVGPLTSEGRERVRTHAQLGERVLARCGGLGGLARDVGGHHERVDGSGYHRGSTEVSVAAGLVGAADVYRALRDDRPHRPAMTLDEAAATLAEAVDQGRIDRRVADAVLGAAGHEAPTPNVRRPAGLTEREVDVLRLIARGRTNKEVAAMLGLSPKTVGSHVEHIYAKAGVKTRPGATLFAMENDLLHE